MSRETNHKRPDWCLDMRTRPTMYVLHVYIFHEKYENRDEIESGIALEILKSFVRKATHTQILEAFWEANK